MIKKYMGYQPNLRQSYNIVDQVATLFAALAQNMNELNYRNLM